MFIACLLVFGVFVGNVISMSLPHSFGYTSADESGNYQYRTETSDATNQRTGSYGFTDAQGIFRQVNYVADKNGFRASVQTNEPGTASSAPANVAFNKNKVPLVSPVLFIAPVHNSKTQGVSFVKFFLPPFQSLIALNSHKPFANNVVRVGPGFLPNTHPVNNLNETLSVVTSYDTTVSNSILPNTQTFHGLPVIAYPFSFLR